MRRPGNWAELALSAWVGLAAGIATAASDFGAHWLFMPSAGDRAWLGVRLLSLQAAAGIAVAVLAGALLFATRRLAERLQSRKPRRTQLQALLLGVLASPALYVLTALLWSGGMMSRLPYKSLGTFATGITLGAALIAALWLALRLAPWARATSSRAAYRVAGLCALAAFLVSKLNQWFLPNLYDYVHGALGLLSFALYAAAATLLALRTRDARPQLGRALAWGAGPLIVLAAGSGYACLRSLDQNQNVRVALLSANMPHSRTLLLAASPLLPRVESRGADLAKQRAAAARARRARTIRDPSLPQLPDAHVLLITIDALRADHLGSYGYKRALSPELDALAQEAQLFERAYAQAPHSSYSLCSLFTSEYLHETTELGTPPPEHTLPRVLAEDGYHSAAFYTDGIFHTAAERLGMYERDAFGFALYDHQDRPPEQMTDRALAEIDRTLSRGEPSALFWVHYFNVHEPYRATTFGTSDVDRYDSEILAADAAIGRLVRSARAKLTKPLVVVITADHGEEFHEHGGVYHGSSLYDEQVHIPLLLLVPGMPAQRYAQPVESIDIVPTLLGLLGIERPSSMRGADLRDLLVHPERERGPVFSAVIHKKMVVSWPHKLIADLRFGAYELYDLAKDPGERQNNADRDPRRLHELRAEIYAWLDTLSATQLAGNQNAQALEWGRLGDRRAVTPLQALLLDVEASATSRSEAARLLGKLADDGAAQSLLSATRTDDDWVAAESAIALGRMFDERARPALRRLVASEDPGIRSRAAVSLARLRDKAAVPALTEALWLAPNPYEREEAVRWLGRLGDGNALDALLNLLPETHTRHLVVVALGDLGDARAFEPLVQTLGWDHNTTVRDGVVRALASLGDARALEVLLPLVEDDSALRNTGEALIRLNALGKGLIGGTDIGTRTQQTGLASCHQGPLKHDWDFLQRTHCRTTGKRASFNLDVPRAVAEAPDGSTLLVSMRRTDHTAPTQVELKIEQQLFHLEADGAWSEQRFVVPSHVLTRGTVRAELQIPQPGARIEVDHVLLVPLQHAGSLAAQQGG
jgi:arylsulfatase A-like enzyme/HEAT repeat protein